MRTSMMKKSARERYAAEWPNAALDGVSDRQGKRLVPGSLVVLPAVRTLADKSCHALVPGLVLGYALGRDCQPLAAVEAPCWSNGRFDRWRTWLVPGGSCMLVDGRGWRMAAEEFGRAFPDAPRLPSCPTESDRKAMSRTWLGLLSGNVRDKGGRIVAVGDLLRIPPSLASHRGGQLRSAGMVMGFCSGRDGSPCAAVDAAGSDARDMVRWRTWVIRLADGIVCDTEEAWRLDAKRFGRRG